MVEHHLRAVGEIAELRFPKSQRVRLGERVAILEAEHGLFRQHRVDDLEARLAVADMIERRVAPLGLLVDQHRWRCEKVPRSQSWPESRTRWPSSSSEQNASASPVAQSMSGAGLDGLAPVLEKPVERAMDVEALRQRR